MPASSWAFNCGTIQAMASATRSDPRHFDGGASLLLASLTLFGTRKVRLFPPGTAMECGTDFIISSLFVDVLLHARRHLQNQTTTTTTNTATIETSTTTNFV